MPHQEIRKLIRIGKSSIAVILPFSWLRYNNLGYGDCIEIISNDSIQIKKMEKKDATE